MNQVLSDLKMGSIELILRGTNLYVSNGDLLESTISLLSSRTPHWLVNLILNLAITNLKNTFQLAVIPRRENAAAEAVQLNTAPIFLQHNGSAYINSETSFLSFGQSQEQRSSL